MQTTTQTEPIPAYLRDAVNRILVLAATANGAAGSAGEVYSLLDAIHNAAYVGMRTHDDILYPSPNFDDEGDVIYGSEEEAPF